MKLNAIIIDDERKLREVLKIKLDDFCPEIKIVETAANIKEAFDKINQHHPQLIFLDIAMPGGSGFDLLEMFDHIAFDIIFVTGFNEYALDALKVSAVDYILKPIKTDDLITAVNKAKERIADRQKIERYELLKHNVNHVGDQETKIAIPGSTAYEFVLIKNIIRCEGWQKYTKIYLVDGSCIVSSYNLGVFKNMLLSYDFYSCHKSHLINKKHINRYLKEGIIILSNENQVPVSRRKKEQFINDVLKKISPINPF